MLRAPFRYSVTLLLGIVIGSISSRWRHDAQVNEATLRQTRPPQSSVSDSTEELRRSAAQVLELASPGGGLQKDAELFEALKKMRADDFRTAALLWTTETLDKLQGDTVRARAVLDRWFELDPESAKSFAKKACTPVPDEGLSRMVLFRQTIAASAAYSDPMWALNHLLFEGRAPWGNPNSNVMAEVVEKDPALAKEWMRRMENSNLRESLVIGYITG
jgi:hypothetical protein